MAEEKKIVPKPLSQTDLVQRRELPPKKEHMGRAIPNIPKETK